MSVWQTDGEWQAPPRDVVAASVAYKITLLVAIVGLIVGLWALTSPTAVQYSDATLGPPLGTNTELGRPGPP